MSAWPRLIRLRERRTAWFDRSACEWGQRRPKDVIHHGGLPGLSIH